MSINSILLYHARLRAQHTHTYTHTHTHTYTHTRVIGLPTEAPITCNCLGRKPRVGQNRIYTPCTTVYLVISLPKYQRGLIEAQNGQKFHALWLIRPQIGKLQI